MRPPQPPPSRRHPPTPARTIRLRPRSSRRGAAAETGDACALTYHRLTAAVGAQCGSLRSCPRMFSSPAPITSRRAAIRSSFADGALVVAPSIRRRAASINVEVIAAVMTVRKPIPTTITRAATTRPSCSLARRLRSPPSSQSVSPTTPYRCWEILPVGEVDQHPGDHRHRYGDGRNDLRSPRSGQLLSRTFTARR